jgi:cation transporter-like permease
MRAGTFAIIVALIIILVGVGAYAYIGLSNGGEPLPADGLIALIVGAFFSIVVGCGLMALVFYSSRRGYDEPPSFRK